MSTARIVFGTDLTYNASPDIVRALQSVLTVLHHNGVSYQLRASGGPGDVNSEGFATSVLLIGPSNPPRFEYSDSNVPEAPEPYLDLIHRFTSGALHQGIVDLTIIRDAIDNLRREAVEEA